MLKVNENVPLAESEPLSNAPLSAVTVCGCAPLLVQRTVVPGATVIFFGVKESSVADTETGAGDNDPTVKVSAFEAPFVFVTETLFAPLGAPAGTWKVREVPLAE